MSKKSILRVQNLEDRSVPTTITLLRGGIISIVGDNDENIAGVRTEGSNVIAQASTWRLIGNQGGVPIYGWSNVTKTYAQRDVVSISFTGNGAGDNFTNDTAYPARAYGGLGDDELIGGPGNDTLIGDAGRDILEGRGGNDVLGGGAGNDTYQYASSFNMGSDTISEVANLERDWVSFKNLSSAVTVNLSLTTVQTVIPGQLSLRFTTSTGIENVDGTGQNDTITGNALGNYIRGRNGNDTINGGLGNDTILGEFGNDSLLGGDGNDELSASFGNDTLRGEGGNDTLDTGSGTDQVFDGLGNDVINFTSHSTAVNFSSQGGNDTIAGSSQSDVLTGGTGNDSIDGGGGNDTLTGNGGNDTLHGSIGNDSLRGNTGNDNLDGGSGNDIVEGGDNNDTLFGGIGNDTLLGGTGVDVLWGLDDDDSLDGGVGADIMYGGHGYDTILADQGNEVMASGETVHITVPDGFPQNDSWICGPNSAARLLQSYGLNVTYSQLRTAAENSGDIIPDFGLGTPSDTLLSIMKPHRPATQMDDDATFEDVLAKIKSGRPVLALIGWGEIFIPGPLGPEAAPEALHWICLTGVDESIEKLFYTDTDGTEQSISYYAFNEQWTDWSAGPFVSAFLSALGVSENTIIW